MYRCIMFIFNFKPNNVTRSLLICRGYSGQDSFAQRLNAVIILSSTITPNCVLRFHYVHGREGRFLRSQLHVHDYRNSGYKVTRSWRDIKTTRHVHRVPLFIIIHIILLWLSAKKMTEGLQDLWLSFAEGQMGLPLRWVTLAWSPFPLVLEQIYCENKIYFLNVWDIQCTCTCL